MTVTNGDSKYRIGNMGQAFDLSSRINMSCEELSGLKRFSVSFWCMTESNANGTKDWVDFLGFVDVATTGNTGQFRFETCYSYGPCNGCIWHDNATYALMSGEGANAFVGKDQWHHVCAVVDSEGTSILYCDAKEIQRTDLAKGGHLRGDFWIGETGSIWGGLSDLRIYDTVLSPKQVHDLSKGMISHYPLNSTYDATEYDVSGFGHNGSHSGGISESADSPRNRGSLDIADSGRISIPYLFTNGSLVNELTYSVWFNMGTQVYSSQLFCLCGNTFSRTRLNSATEVQSYSHVSNQDHSTVKPFSVSATAPYKLDDHKWHFYCFTFKNGTVRMYLDGMMMKEQTDATAPYLYYQNGSSFINSYSNSENFVGKMSDARVYATALSSDDVADLYRVSASIDCYGNVMVSEVLES